MWFRRVLGSILLAAALALMLVPAAMAVGPHPDPNALEKCWATIVNQDAHGVVAGGGPKEGIGPTNCDHFFQGEGLIGNNLPGFPTHP
jgi:hypothetical protein